MTRSILQDPEGVVLWMDALLLVVNKPAGLATLPDGYDPGAPHLKSVLEPAFGPLWIVHRLDRNTSGAVLLARSSDAHQSLNIQFETRAIAKVYHALVLGNPSWQDIDSRLPLRADGDRRHRTVVDHQSGKEAHTQLRVLERYAAPRSAPARVHPTNQLPHQPFQWTLLEARPRTGRTHQIRAHLASAGLPIVADALYGGESLYLSQLKPGYIQNKGSETPLLERQALHAQALTFKHPTTGDELSIHAPYPKDLQIALRQLRKHGLLT